MKFWIGNLEFVAVGSGVSILLWHVIVVGVKMGLVEFSGPVETLIFNQKRKRVRQQIICWSAY